MKKVLIFGIDGKMGGLLSKAIEKDNELEVAFGVDLKENLDGDIPIFDDIEKVSGKVDVIIDFSSPKSLGSILSYAVKNSVPAVLCATGYSEEDISRINSAAKVIPVFRSANMSQGINLVAYLSQLARKTLFDYDIEIVEKHHNRKKDAPSGTALYLANAIQAVDDRLFVNTSRLEKQGARNECEIGVSSIRGGNIVGEHEVMFIGENEIVTIKHEALSRSVFADGAIAAAKFLLDKPAGLYDMNDMLG